MLTNLLDKYKDTVTRAVSKNLIIDYTIAALYLKNDDFFDEDSKIVYNQLAKTNSSVRSRVMINIERFEIGQSYVTAKIQNRYGDNVSINIQGGRPGIEIQESWFKLKEQEKPSYAYFKIPRY